MDEDEIKLLPNRFQGFLLSPFQYNVHGEYVRVPEDTFREMIALIEELAMREKLERDEMHPPAELCA